MSLQLNNIRWHWDGIWGAVERQHGMKGTDSGLTSPELESWLGYSLAVSFWASVSSPVQ